MRIKDKVFVVTGGASGIGYSICKRIVEDGAIAVLADINRELAESASRTLSPDLTRAVPVVMDVASEDSVKAAVGAVVDRFGRIDVLVNNAGIGRDVPFLETSLELFRRTLDVNLSGAFVCAQVVAKQMVRQKAGRIINIASVSGVRGNKGRAAYGSSKGGVISLTKVMAGELAPYGILVNAIAPGPVETPMVAAAHTEYTRKAWIESLALRRYATPEELAGPVVFLASDDASYITGHTLNVDGGFVGCGFLPEQGTS